MIPTQTGQPVVDWRWPLALLLALSAAAPATAETPAQTAAGEAALRAAEPVKPGWQLSASFPAPEAHQAAAADDQHVYVISSTVVAAYDRSTGERQWVSRGGGASHLNSGFLWQGKLLCAHSNYPDQPNTSQIKAVDLSSRELADFKDFGVSDGSLTWVVRHADAWWCNFAFYGTEQQKTRLVRYDDQWHETGSWTYPPQLYRWLGQYSLSGGIWHGDTLLVTDHDHPVVYRLRLPSAGSELEWIDRRSVPFTGQGFAVDPASDSASGNADNDELNLALIGINRSKRLVIFAQPVPLP